MACHQQLRSTSLPLRPHALVQELEDELQRLRSGAAASSSSSSPASLAERLSDAYGRVEELVRLPGARDALWGARWRGAVEAELDASVALLDLCQRARDAAAAAKRHVRAARSALRRSDAAGAKAAVRGYVRCLAKAGKECNPKSKARTKHQVGAETPAAVRVLSEAVAVTVAVLQCVTSSLSARVVDTTRKSKWCIVSKLFGSDCSLGGSSLCDDLDGDDDGVLRAQEMLQELDDTGERRERAGAPVQEPSPEQC